MDGFTAVVPLSDVILCDILTCLFLTADPFLGLSVKCLY